MYEITGKFPSIVKSNKEGKNTILSAKGYWTKNGKKIKGSDFNAPEGANDHHVIIKIIIEVQFTKDGKLIGKSIPQPEGANDVHIEIKPKVEA